MHRKLRPHVAQVEKFVDLDFDISGVLLDRTLATTDRC
jgi:hypothetical protein